MEYTNLGQHRAPGLADLPRDDELRKRQRPPVGAGRSGSGAHRAGCGRGWRHLFRHRQHLLRRGQRGGHRPIATQILGRDEVVVATKVFMPMTPGENGSGLSRKHILSAIDASLARLDMEYVDLYQIHRWDPRTPIEETMEALHDVVRAGKARYIGASSMFSWQFAKAQHVADLHHWTRFVSMQPHYNLIYREEEREMIPQCLDQGVGVIPWSPLGTRRPGRQPDTGRRAPDHPLRYRRLHRLPLQPTNRFRRRRTGGGGGGRANGAVRPGGSGLGTAAAGGHRPDRRGHQAQHLSDCAGRRTTPAHRRGGGPVGGAVRPPPGARALRARLGPHVYGAGAGRSTKWRAAKPVAGRSPTWPTCIPNGDVQPLVETRTGATMDQPSGVDFHFDIMCPYAYQTSLWIREVREQAGIDVRWRFFSLEEINRAEGKKHPWEREWSYGWSMMRVGALLRRQSMELLDDWYRAAGRALHVDGRKPHRPEVAEELLVELGLDPGIVRAAIDDPTTGDEVQAEHQTVVSKGGFGVPTLVFDDGQALFGPVLINPPTGKDAVRLWELVDRLARVPQPLRAATAEERLGHRCHRHRLRAVPRGPRLAQRPTRHSLSTRSASAAPAHSGSGSGSGAAVSPELAQQTEADGREQHHRQHARGHQRRRVDLEHATLGQGDAGDDHDQRKPGGGEHGHGKSLWRLQDPPVEEVDGHAPRHQHDETGTPGPATARPGDR